jgi:hypothetical protein
LIGIKLCGEIPLFSSKDKKELKGLKASSSIKGIKIPNEYKE